MSTLTMPVDELASGLTDARPQFGLFARLIRSREALAKRQVLSLLAAQDDTRLMALGYGADDIAAIRKGELRIPVVR